MSIIEEGGEDVTYDDGDSDGTELYARAAFDGVPANGGVPGKMRGCTNLRRMYKLDASSLPDGGRMEYRISWCWSRYQKDTRYVVALRDHTASSLERLALRQDAQPMSTDVQAPTSVPQGAAQRIVLVLAIVLVPTVPIVAFNVAIVAAAVTALRRSRAWRWYLLIAALAWVLLMIDPTPFGIGEFRSSEGEVF